ncbi:MAG TPA: MJ0042-type zinc finger domain-containing protein [Azospirillaceae bacterium]|nr:MJ0042-type zinc finger domain-containing protein [Azospirillaceae bacterium]
MILTCPSCAKRFLLDAALLGNGRRVRCGRCAHTWYQEPPADAPAIASAVPPPTRGIAQYMDDDGPLADLLQSSSRDDGDYPRFEEPEEPAPIRQRPVGRVGDRPMGKPSGKVHLPAIPGEERRRVGPALLKWGGLVAVLALVAGGAVAGREPIVKAWEPAARLYEVIGMPVEPVGAGLELAQGKAEYRDLEGTAMLFVEVPVTNKTQQPRRVPDLIANAIAPDGKLLQSWRMRPSARELPPGGNGTYSSRVPERGGQAKDITFEFAAPEAP